MNGYIVTGEKDGVQNSIFIPASGYRMNYDLVYHNEQGKYWSSNVSSDPCDAKGMNFTPSSIGIAESWDRHNGRCIRPVFGK